MVNYTVKLHVCSMVFRLRDSDTLLMAEAGASGGVGDNFHAEPVPPLEKCLAVRVWRGFLLRARRVCVFRSGALESRDLCHR